jgi:hypothetical protein
LTVSQRSGVVTMPITSFLAADQFREPNACTVLGVNYPGGGNADVQYLIIATDATVPVGAYVEIESEFWLSNDSIMIQPLQRRAGSGVPVSSADFVSQEYYDTVNKKFYTAIDVGKGAADWVLGS